MFCVVERLLSLLLDQSLSSVMVEQLTVNVLIMSN